MDQPTSRDPDSLVLGSTDPDAPVTRASLDAMLADPACPLHASAALYHRAMDVLSREPLGGKHVLEYACGTAEFGIWIATEGAEVHLLDRRESNIAEGLRRAAASGVGRRVKGIRLGNPSNLDMFADEAFEIVFSMEPEALTSFGPGAIAEVWRIMKPGARLVLAHGDYLPGELLESLRERFADVEAAGTVQPTGFLAKLRPPKGPVLITAWK
jgi:SAM-dependent methyltransferase